jgi:uncharacterized phage protein (TIGR01671 family)
MREIKFRAWYKPKKKMYSKSLESINFETKVLGVYTISDGYQQLRMSDFEITQYTGLKDKNGREIYEGDIVQDLNGKVYRIKWGINSNGFIAVTNEIHGSVYSSYHLAPKTVVIGNIYENPELLTA